MSKHFPSFGEYLALPARTYSAGMLMRLGFALVSALDPGVLLMGEGIGAGDARFAESAQRRLSEFVGCSRIVVIASHSHDLIKSICNKAPLLQAGRLASIGSVEEVFEQAARTERPQFFVFSDEPEWARGNLQFRHPTTLVAANPANRGHFDMALMSRCRHFILANSSFSWWGAWLNPSREKIVVAPSRWFNAGPPDTRDLVPQTWVRL